jgi:hypothetical protein
VVRLATLGVIRARREFWYCGGAVMMAELGCCSRLAIAEGEQVD